MRSEVIEGIG